MENPAHPQAGRGLFWLMLSIPVWTIPVGANDKTDEQPYRLDEVVVSATRTEKKPREAPASVTVITREEIERQNVRTVDEALRYSVGVQVKRSKGIADATPRVQLRGLYGQDRTLILVDGLPVNDGYSAAAPWTQLSIDAIERIEITRGPGSALYGGNAVGGVINLITRRPDAFEARARAGVGSDHTWRLGASVGGKLHESVGVRVGVEREETDGYPTIPVQRPITRGTGTLTGGEATTTPTGTPQWIVGDRGDNWGERQNINLQAVFDPLPETRLVFDLQHGYHRYGYDRPNSIVRDAQGQRVFSGNVIVGPDQRATIAPANYIFFSGLGEETITVSALTWEQTLFDWQLTAKLGYLLKDDWYTSNSATGAQNYDNAPGTLADSQLDGWLAEVQATRLFGHHLVTAGLFTRRNRFDQKEWNLRYYRDEGSQTTQSTLTEGKDQFYAIFLQDEWRFAPQWALYVGARYDRWKAFDGEAGNIGRVRSFEEPDGDALSPKIAVVWSPDAITAVRFAASRAFRPPTIYELYRTWQSGSIIYNNNPDLKPETLWNVEIGGERQFWEQRVRIAGTVFYSRLKDAIERYAIENQRFWDNVGEATIRGVELEVDVYLIDGLKLWANASFIDSEVLESERNPAAEGKRLPNIADKVFNIGVEYQQARWRLALDGNYRGRTYTTDLNNDKADDVYGAYSRRWLWDFKATAVLHRHVELSFSVENLFDEDYYDFNIGRGRNYFLELVGKF